VNFSFRAISAVVIMSISGWGLSGSTAFGQAPPTTVPDRRPTLKRDRSQRVLYPKIIQSEDERLVSTELTEIVNSSHGGAKKRAILALGRIGYPSGISVLVDLLNSGGRAQDSSDEFRALAAFSLGEVEHNYPVAVLLDHLNPDLEKSALVRIRCAEALGKIGSNRFSIAALGQYGISGLANTLAERLPPPSGQPLSPDDKMLTSMLLTALLRLRQAASVPAIAAQLGSSDEDIRWQAANALARIREGVANAVPALLPLLADKNELVRAYAARALGVAKAAPAVDPLIKLLSETDARVVTSAVNALGAIADARAAEPLIALGNKLLEGYRAADRDRNGWPTQQNQLLLIAAALGQIKDARALPFLKAFRAAAAPSGANPEVEMAIARFGDQAFFDSPDDPGKLAGGWKTVSARAQGLGQLGTDRARTALGSLYNDVLANKPYALALPDILNALAAVKAEGLRKNLLDQLKGEDVIVRATAATLLGELKESSEEVVQALDAAYKSARADKMNDARIAIMEALEKLGHPLSVEVLTDQTRDSDYVVRLRASELFRQSRHQVATKLNIGKVDTGHDRAYWQRVAQLSSSAANPVAILRTKKGDIRIELLARDAPMAVDNFITLSRSGFYNGLTFMRVVPNFVIQGGDPRGDMNGGPGYQIRDEINLNRYGAGAVGMALSGKDTGGSQFFITHSPQPHLDGGYTVFGQVIDGMDVVNRIARGDVIERVEIVESRPKIE
jgi:cyclophilin family peptidyl-prolyl cis-trans isomerase/HEAT repeat protein